MTYRKDIQILRGVAVLLVVLFHLGFGAFQSGFLGVDVFFVVSGFLMAILYNPKTKIDFFKKRALRLLPAYFVVVILVVFASIILVIPNEYNQVFEQSIYADLFASNIGFWMQNSYFSKSEFNPLLHLWSLGVEIQFYLIIPLLVYFIKKHPSFLWIIGVSSLVACFVIVEISPKTSFFMMPLRLWEFMVGYVVARHFTISGNIQETRPIVGSVFFVVILAIPLFNLDGNATSIISGHPGLHALLITFSTGFILAFGLPNKLESSFIGGFLEVIGKYSYSIYLVHFPVIVLYLYQPFSGTRLQSHGLADLAILLIAITVLSIIVYHLAEVKLRKNNKILIILLTMPIAIITISSIGYVAQRYIHSDIELKIFDAFVDRSPYRCGKIFRIMNPNSITCELTKYISNKEGSVLLIGNSHADSIKTVFSEVATSKGVKVYFLVPNNPLMDGSGISIAKVLDEAKQHNSDHIVMHYSPSAISTSAISSLAREAEKNGIKISFIMPVPVWEEHIPEALYYNHKHARPLPSQTKNDYLTSTSALRKALRKIELPNFKVYEVYNYFCNDKCALLSDGRRPLYFDSAHLTLTGSTRLSQLFENILQD